MATITPVIGYQMTVMIGDGAQPEVFAHPALINTSRGLTITVATESDELPDSSDWTKPAVTVRRTRAVDTKIDGAGMIHAPDVKTYMEWAATGVAKNVKLTCGNAVVTGKYILTSFQVSAERVKTAEVQMTLEQADAVTVTTAS